MNTGHDQCRELAESIRDIFAAGFQAEAATVHFINSTFDYPDSPALRAVLNDRADCEREGLIELIISPDATVRLETEELLTRASFAENDIQAVMSLLPPEISTSLRMTGLTAAVPFSVPSSGLRRFLSQLNLTRPIPADIRVAIETHLPERPDRLAALAKIRHSRLSPADGRSTFLPRFISLFGRTEKGRWFSHLDLILVLIDRWKTCLDMFDTFGAEKEHCRRMIEKSRQLEGRLAGNNLETLMLQGCRIGLPGDISKLLQNIKTIDEMALLVWGRVPADGSPGFQEPDDILFKFEKGVPGE